MRNCNLIKFGYNFMQGLDNVQNLCVTWKHCRSNVLVQPTAY